jgi:hypothetical protein
MRKVLLATTALVAMSVTAAQADVSISGNAEYHYTQPSTGANLTEMDGNITIKGSSTADSGVTYGVVYNQSVGQSNAGADGGTVAVEDIYLDISGDFGRVFLGQTDQALDGMDGYTGNNMTIEGHAGSVLTTALTSEEATPTANFISPSINGVTLGAQVDDTNGNTGFAVQYQHSMGTIGYQSLGGGGQDQTVVMGSVSVGNVTIGAASKETDTSGVKTTASDIGVNYSMGDVLLSAVAQKSSNGAKTQTFGAQYTVAPGVYAQIEQVSDRTAAAVDSTSTFMALGIQF